jgi:exonuclease VII large subunit
MNNLNILRPITVRAKVTERLKERLTGELKDAVRMLDQEVEQLDSQLKRAQLTLQNLTPQQQIALRQQVDMEKQRRHERKQQLLQEMRAVSDLPLGSEIVQGTVQSLATVGVGDDWEELFTLEVLLDDGKVIEIRRTTD